MHRNLFAGLALIVCIAASTKGQAQYYFYNDNYYDRNIILEVGGSTGVMSGITDIGGRKGFRPNPKSSHLSAGFYVGAMYQSVLGLRLEFTEGRISGADSLGLHPKRNLSFRSSIRELALIGELHPLMLFEHEKLPRLSPYLAVGTGWFAFNPQANLNGNWIDLQPLRTEGQGFAERPETKPYQLNATSLITGAGIKWDISPFITARAEVMVRYTSSDYLDDASTFYVDPAWFDSNLSPQAAMFAKELHDRSVVKDPTYSGPGAIRSSAESNDHFMSVNLKLAFSLGRQRVK